MEENIIKNIDKRQDTRYNNQTNYKFEISNSKDLDIECLSIEYCLYLASCILVIKKIKRCQKY